MARRPTAITTHSPPPPEGAATTASLAPFRPPQVGSTEALSEEAILLNHVEYSLGVRPVDPADGYELLCFLCKVIIAQLMYV